MSFKLTAEWSEQGAIMLTWPHKNTDWANLLERVELLYIQLSTIITRYQSLILVVHDKCLKVKVRNLLLQANLNLNNVYFVICPSNDSWSRDHGPITLTDSHGEHVLLNFTFNGWGNKYPSNLDDQITHHVYQQAIDKKVQYQSVDFVLEGGAIETDGQGTLLTTRQCLLNTNRNPQLTQCQIENTLKRHLGINKILWLTHGQLDGDDTDSHIDTLVRFAPDNKLLYVSCDDKKDSQYAELKLMEQELTAFTTDSGDPIELIPLPSPDAKFNAAGDRLPATYANFLIINHAVLVPIYQDEQDEVALAKVQIGFPEHKIIPIDCSVLIEQFGSLHCISMQLPKGTLNTKGNENE